MKCVCPDSNKNSNQHKQRLALENFHATSQKHQVKHKYTQAYHPWTNGQEERKNRTLKQATVDKYFYKDYNCLQKHLNLFLKAYNYAKHLRNLKGNTPFEELCLFYHKGRVARSCF